MLIFSNIILTDKTTISYSSYNIAGIAGPKSCSARNSQNFENADQRGLNANKEGIETEKKVENVRKGVEMDVTGRKVFLIII